MISRLRGKIVEKDLKSFIIEIGGDENSGGIGYLVNTTEECVSSLPLHEGPKSKEVIIYTHLAVREDAQNLYGFTKKEELEFFELLITVSGIGPKTALGILNTARVDDIRKAVETEDTDHLVKVAGLGKKVAEKIVMELKDKASFAVVNEKRRQREKDLGGKDKSDNVRDDGEVIEALKALGYKEQEARESLKKIYKDKDNSNKDIGDIIKIALKLLSNSNR